MRKPPHPRRSRFDNVSHEDIRARWRAAMPMFIKWLFFSALAIPALFLLNHFWQPDQKITNVLAIAFRIAIGGAGLFAFLTVSALIFSRPKTSR